MKKIITTWLLSLSLSLAFGQSKSFTQTISGSVTDAQSGSGLANVTISVNGQKSNYSTITDSLGNFSLPNVPVGRQEVFVSRVGYLESTISNIEVTSSKEVILELKLKENIKSLDNLVITSTYKLKSINQMAVISARQLSTDEAIRYSGTRNDPSRMAQNFAGVSGTNDARNDIVIRGNSPSGVLWRMEGIDIPNPNHFSTMGATGGPVTLLNINTLRNSDFLTGAFPAQYGNALAGVFDLRLRNGNPERYEFLGEMGFNGFEFGAEGPLNKKTKSSFIADYRYSMVSTMQSLGINVGTGVAIPYYQDGTFKVHIVTKKSGTFDIFGLGGESHINFPASDSSNNLYTLSDGIARESNSKSITGIVGFNHTYFFNKNTSGKFMMALSAEHSKFNSYQVKAGAPIKMDNDLDNLQNKLSAGYTLNRKYNARNQLTIGASSDILFRKLKEGYIANGDSILATFINSKNNSLLLKGFLNYNHHFTNLLTTNIGVYAQYITMNKKYSVEPRWNLRYQLRPNQSISFGTGLHSQLQPLEVYFYQSRDAMGHTLLTNKNLGFTKSVHFIAGYDVNFGKQIRLKAEIYDQIIFDAPVENTTSSFSLLNAGASFGFPEKANLVNNGRGKNYGLELTLEKFLHHGLYFLVTSSIFTSKYKGSDNVWRNSAFDGRYVVNILGGKEFSINQKTSFGIDSKFAIAGGQRYTPFDVPASKASGYVIYQENKAYSLHNNAYVRWDLKFTFTRSAKHITQKWYVDLQNLTNNKNIFSRQLNPLSGTIKEVYQIGFFPNINYRITF